MENYSFNLHQHNYAVWTAARAVQRGFTTTANIKLAIDASSLQQFAENPKAEGFDAFHRKCAKELIAGFAKQGVKTVSYGRAAKIIAIYLKTVLILPLAGEGDVCEAIHPPIDRILLHGIAEKAPSNLEKCDGKVLAKEEHQALKELKKIAWTELDEKKYWELVEGLRKYFPKFDWRLEQYWHPEQSEE